MGTPLVDPRLFLAYAQAQEGKLYMWARKGPNWFDCSGLVTYCLRAAGGPHWRFDHDAQRLFDKLLPIYRPAPGQVCLAFYGHDSQHINHVMVVVGDGRVLGACGGDRTTASVELAKEKGACVQYRPSVNYRKDFVGYRALELAPPTPGEPTNVA